VRAALAALPEQERAAVLLRDGYDLPPQALAVALRRDLESAQALVAAGRLRLVSHYDDRAIPDLGVHEGRMTGDAGTLGALADGTLPAPRAVPLRRHLGGCTACEDAVEMMAKGRRLAAALPVVAMPDDAREAMLERVTHRASAALPTVEEVLLAIDEDESLPPMVSPIAVVLAVVAALVFGVAVAAITANRPGGDAVALASPQPPSVSPAFPVAPLTQSQTPGAHRSAKPTTTTSAVATSAAPTGGATTAPPSSAGITLDPTSGARGTSITVTGRGWTPGSIVTVRYSGTLAGAGNTVDVDSQGDFTAEVTANAALPGSYTVSATDGSQTDSQPFRQTS
jgi:anti-sigma factor RsiW